MIDLTLYSSYYEYISNNKRPKKKLMLMIYNVAGVNDKLPTDALICKIIIGWGC